LRSSTRVPSKEALLGTTRPSFRQTDISAGSPDARWAESTDLRIRQQIRVPVGHEELRVEEIEIEGEAEGSHRPDRVLALSRISGGDTPRLAVTDELLDLVAAVPDAHHD